MQLGSLPLRNWLRASLQISTFFGLAMIGLTWIGIATLMNIEANQALQGAKQNTGNLTRVFEEQVLRTIEQGDKILLSLKASYTNDPGRFDIEDARSYLAGLVTQVSAIGPDGYLKAATIGQNLGERIDLSDREHFRVHVNTDKDELFISKPVVGRTTGISFIRLSRRLSNPDGSFGGVITASIYPSVLSQLYGSIDVGKDGMIALIGLDGALRAARGFSHNAPEDSVSEPLPFSFTDTPLFKHLQESPAGFFLAQGRVDGIRRLISYRKVASLPLVVTVGLAEREVFASYWRDLRSFLGFATVLTIIVLIIIALSVRRKQEFNDLLDYALQAQKSLVTSQERYQMVEAAVNDGVWDESIAADECYLSPRWKAILGYDDHELPNVRSTFLDLIHPDDRETVAAKRREYLESENNTTLMLDLRLRHKDGSYRWIHSRGRLVRDTCGKPIRMLGTSTDITESKLAADALRQSEERYRLIEGAVNDGLWDWNILTDDCYLSPRWKAILGYDNDEILNVKSSCFNLLHPDEKSAVVEATRAHLDEQKPYALDLRLRSKNGDYRWVHSRGTAVYDAANRPVRMVGAITDITDRKRAEDMLLQLNRELEARVRERTDALVLEMRRREEAQSKLAQVQKLEAVGQLTAGIAHDFNNLLAVIQGSLEFVDGAAASGLTAEPELISAALRATCRGKELVRRLLTFARQSPARAEPTTVDQFVLDTLRLLQRTLGEHVSIETHLNAVGSLVFADRSQLANVLLNLALNARDAMPDGGQLTISTSRGPAHLAAEEGPLKWPTGEEVRIVISDTGIGMTDEVNRRAFEPFFTTKPDGLGTGLGLSMVHGFVQQCGGSIEVDSKPGNGTTITICLPKIEVANEPDEPGTVTSPRRLTEQKVVLLVEDDPDVRIVTAAQLKQLGYKVNAVANGNEAIDVIESPARVDILLTDIVLPGGVDGVSLMKTAMEVRPTIGVLCMSGYDPTLTHRKWLQVQNIGFLEKPFSSTGLAKVLEGTLAA